MNPYDVDKDYLDALETAAVKCLRFWALKPAWKRVYYENMTFKRHAAVFKSGNDITLVCFSDETLMGPSYYILASGKPIEGLK